MAEEVLFRSNKRRKVFRKKDTEDDARESPDLAADAQALVLSTAATDDEDVGASIGRAFKPARRRPFAKPHGIAFAAAATSARSTEMEDVLLPAHDDDGHAEALVQTDRFVKPTGRVGVVEDKHLYVNFCKHMRAFLPIERNIANSVGPHT